MLNRQDYDNRIDCALSYIGESETNIAEPYELVTDGRNLPDGGLVLTLSSLMDTTPDLFLSNPLIPDQIIQGISAAEDKGIVLVIPADTPRHKTVQVMSDEDKRALAKNICRILADQTIYVTAMYQLRLRNPVKSSKEHIYKGKYFDDKYTYWEGSNGIPYLIGRIFYDEEWDLDKTILIGREFSRIKELTDTDWKERWNSQPRWYRNFTEWISDTQKKKLDKL